WCRRLRRPHRARAPGTRAPGARLLAGRDRRRAVHQPEDRRLAPRRDFPQAERALALCPVAFRVPPPPRLRSRRRLGDGGGRMITADPDRAPFISGMWASAGGPEALASLIAGLTLDSMGFVIVQHLSPDHESSLPALLS